MARLDIWELMIIVPLFIISIGLHEAAHAYSAAYFGDRTPADEGRLTINPLVHLDPLGTLMLVMVGFGWGRSVNVDPRNLRNPQLNMAVIAAAGPAANLALGIISALGWLAVRDTGVAFLGEALAMSAGLNLLLMFLNLVPIPPLDGSKVLRAFLPVKLGQKFDDFAPYGSIVFLALIFLPGVSTVFMGTLYRFMGGTLSLLTGGALGV